MAVGLAVAMATMLSSCSILTSPPEASAPPAEPGISREAAADLLNAVPGLELASVGSVISGISAEVLVEVYVDDESAILADGVLDYVLRVGWATEVPSEPDFLSLTVWSNGTRLDLQPQVMELTGAAANLESVGAMSAYLDSAAEYLGEWPGAVPTPPAG